MSKDAVIERWNETLTAATTRITLGFLAANMTAEDNKTRDEVYARLLAYGVHCMAQACLTREPMESAVADVVGQFEHALRHCIDDLINRRAVMMASIEAIGETRQ